MPLFQWITFAQMKAALASRLAITPWPSVQPSFWVDDELGRYIKEALRTWNALTNIWNADFDLSPIITANQIWYPLQSQVGYPRKRTVRDQEVEILMAYHLLEPPGLGTGGFGFNFGANFGWGNTPPGTGMFTMQEMSDALERRRDEIIQVTACNLAEITIATTPNTRANYFPDTTLSPLRARFVPAPGMGTPRTLWRNDDLALEYFSPGYLQGKPNAFQSPGTGPKEYGVITKPPLGFSVDFPPTVPGSYDFIVVEAGVPLDPPASSILGLPDDFCWVAKWGAMSDLLGMESEATDPERAEYCLQRYRDGVTLMQKAPWILLATLNGVAIETASVLEMDDYAIEWDSAQQTQSVVTAGMDFLAISPVPSAPPLPGATITVVGNAPVPLYDSDFVQVSRDTIDAILDYAQHLADFKMGGADFAQSKELARNFFLAAIATNSRLTELGLFRDLLLNQGLRQGEADPRFVKES